MIHEQPDWQVCGSANEYVRALKQIKSLKPDLIILNLDLSGRSGLELVRELQRQIPKARALVFSMQDERLYASRAIRAGASGYVMKQEPPETIAAAIRHVLDGGIYLSRHLEQQRPSRGLRGQGSGEVQDRLETLTNRELHIFRLIGQGRRSQEIARLLSVSVKTIGSHRSNMMAKLCLENASQLVQQAIELNREHLREKNGEAHSADTSHNVIVELESVDPLPNARYL